MPSTYLQLPMASKLTDSTADQQPLFALHLIGWESELQSLGSEVSSQLRNHVKLNTATQSNMSSASAYASRQRP